jgi:hypothetical protein
LAIDIFVAGPRNPTTEPLIVGNVATREPVWAIGDGDARNASVGALVVLTGETRHAIVGIVAARGRSKAPTYFEIARIVGVAALAIGRARTTWGHETAFQIIATGLETHLARRTGIVVVTEVFFVGACRAKRAGAAATPSIEAGVETSVRTSV